MGVARPQAIKRQRPKLAFVAVCPAQWPWLCDRYPGFKVKDTRSRSREAAVEHLRLIRGTDLSGLPGLAGPAPSLLRDAVSLAFSAGAPTVDIVVARGEGLAPSDVAEPLAMQLLTPFVRELQGILVVLPDAAGPASVGVEPVPFGPRISNLVRAVRMWSPVLSREYQVGFADLPHGPPEVLFRALELLSGTDFALSMWAGRPDALLRHGWRSGAAVTAGLAAASDLPIHGIAGLRLRLPGGRRVDVGRLRELGVDDPPVAVPEFASHAVVGLQLHGSGADAEVLAEPTLRAPAGTWSVPMLRTAKLVHHRLVIAANQFVFRPATPQSALNLQNALRLALQDLEKREIVGGAGKGDPARVVASAVPKPHQPALMANVTAYLRPWLRRINVDITVRPGEQPLLEVA